MLVRELSETLVMLSCKIECTHYINFGRIEGYAVDFLVEQLFVNCELEMLVS
jgi:hypothetical protein